MMECPHCGALNKDESKFCGECGQPVGTRDRVTCPMCDYANPPRNTVCSRCGARLIPVGVAPSEESSDLVEVGDGDALDEEEKREEASEAPEAAREESMPPWLQKLRDVPAEDVVPEDEAVPLAPAELPDWLEVPPEFEDVMFRAAEQMEETEEEEMPLAEIPPWLEALRPEEAGGVVRAGQVEEPPEEAGLLKGITGTLSAEPILAIPPRAIPLPEVALSALAYEQAEVFDRVVREPARPSPEIARPRRLDKLVASTVRSIIYLIIATAVVVPLLVQSTWSGSKLAATSSTIDMYNTIESLPADSAVLVSHDYEAALAGEMSPQATAVLGHLMARHIRLLNVSLTAEGARLSQQVLDELAEAYQYEYGKDYLNLGYVVGVEGGPRSVVEGLGDPGWTDFVGDIADISLIVEFAGAPEYLRLWLEQVQGPYQVPMVAGVSATVDPFARPYYQNQPQPQLLGMVTGLVGAAEYERHSGRPGPALASMDSQSVVHVAIVLLILGGNVAYFAGKLRKAPGR